MDGWLARWMDGVRWMDGWLELMDRWIYIIYSFEKVIQILFEMMTFQRLI